MDDNTWINCPHCELKHRPRSQGLCPRCGRTTSRPSSTAAASVAVPRVGPPEIPPPARESEHIPTVEYIPSLEPAPTWERRALGPEPEPRAGSSSGASAALPIAGVILLVNAVLHLFEFLFLPSVSTDASLRAAQLAGTLVGVGLDALLGIGFLRGKTRLRTLAVIRLLVGMFLFGSMSLYQAQYLFTLVVLAFSCGMLVLVWGTPSSFLAGAGLTAVLLGVAVELIGFQRLSAIQPLGDRARIALRPELEGRQLGQDESIVGDRHPYKLRVPSDGWYRRKSEVARSPDASVDVWLSQPEHTGGLVVAVRQWNEAEAATLQEARDLELRDLRVRYPDFQLTDTSDNGTPLRDATIASLTGSAARNGEPFTFEVSLHKTKDKLLVVTAFAPTSTFALLHLEGATTGFRPD